MLIENATEELMGSECKEIHSVLSSMIVNVALHVAYMYCRRFRPQPCGDLFEDENAEMTHLGSGLFHDKDEQ